VRVRTRAVNGTWISILQALEASIQKGEGNREPG